MPIKQAKVLTSDEFDSLVKFVRSGGHPERDEAILMLSHKAGLRSSEIAGLKRSDVMTASGEIANEIFIGSHIGKKGKSRTVPMHSMVKDSLNRLFAARQSAFIVYSPYDRTDGMTPNALTVMLHRLYKQAKLEGASSHSGRRGFITNAARRANLAGCSLRDVQEMAGHADLRTTQAYIQLSDNAPNLVEMI